MKLINTLALSTLFLATTLAFADENKHDVDVNINIEKNKSAMILVNNDGKETKIDIPYEALSDATQLESYLQDIPEPEKSKLLASLTNIKTSGDFTWVEGSDGEHSEEHTVIIDIDDDKLATNDDEKTIIIKELMPKLHKKVMVLKSDGKHKVSLLKRLIKDGKFSEQELNELQKLLDEKR